MAMSKRAGAEINVTPLIDVLLVLLIIFMVITPVTPKGLTASIPQPQQSAGKSPERTIVIQVSGHDLRINNETVPVETLGTRLAEIFKTRAERVAFVQGDANVEFRGIARVIDIARSAGVDRVGLLPGSTDGA